ncbi:zinc finger protein basonuclin-1 [Tamandua tetradactyla]|uniref:zinc finger protein basonuclin-1 n=1 Tax=Tamandua tetradactyla TaxID=48850 RepID=UPI004053E129
MDKDLNTHFSKDVQMPAVGCTLNCSCQSFTPGKVNRRQCEQCTHGWVAHALSRLRPPPAWPPGPVEVVQSSVVLGLGSLVLYGTRAIPVRLKILLDRLFGVLQQDEVLRILHALGWTLPDYVRGYALQDASGRVLDHWSIMSTEEEVAALQQFLRFGETRALAELMAVQEQEEQPLVLPPPTASVDIRAFLGSCSPRLSGVPTPMDKGSPSSLHPFETLMNGMALMLPLPLFSTVPPALAGPLPEQYVPEPAQDPFPGPRPEIHAPFPDGSFFAPSPAPFQGEEEQGLGSPDPAPQQQDGARFGAHRTQLSPGARAKSERPGLGTKKGRVFCTACEKTFYDKGTLKIHYNAVHLKIKHRCTVAGCNMVFSSLRSRNRHSANPNPRLHAPTNRNCRDKDLRGGPGPCRPLPGCPGGAGADGQAPPVLPGAGQLGVLAPRLRTVQPVPPFSRGAPAELPPSPPARAALAPECRGIFETSPEATPKKKSRKSSMPVKIEKDAGAEPSGPRGRSPEREAAPKPAVAVLPRGPGGLEGRRALGTGPECAELWPPLLAGGLPSALAAGAAASPRPPGARAGPREERRPCGPGQGSLRPASGGKAPRRATHAGDVPVGTAGAAHATAPPRRGRHRHSSDLQLPQKLFTQEALQGRGDQPWATRLPPLIFGGAGRVGSVLDPPTPECGAGPLGEDIVLDLSTASSARSDSSSRSSWGSDGASEAGDSDVPGDEGVALRVLTEPTDRGLASLPPGLPITRPLCQETCRSRGTLRARHRAVHLRQLHGGQGPGGSARLSPPSPSPSLHGGPPPGPLP